MGALVLLPPLPPIEAERGQQCFGFVDITFVVRMVVPRRRRPKAVAPAPIVSPIRPQLRIEDWKPARVTPPDEKPVRRYVLRTHRHLSRRGAELTEFERAEMERDVALLEAQGVYDTRPRRGNGIDGDCQPGPCGFVSCRHNLYLTVDPRTGSIRMNFPGKDVDQIGETCSLRVAAAQAPDADPMPYDEVGEFMGLSGMGVRYVEVVALDKLNRSGVMVRLRRDREE